MKRFGLKTANYVGYLGASAGVGYLSGRLLKLIFGRILTEEIKESKPVLYYGILVLEMILLVGVALAWGFLSPAQKIYELIDSKIDEVADERDWD